MPIYIVLVPVGNRAKEIVLKEPETYASFPEKEVYVCFLPEMTGQEENFLINSMGNLLVLVYPMGEEFSEKVILSQDIAKRFERRKSKIILYDDEMKKFPHYAFSKLVEFREHLLFLLHMAFVQRDSIFLGNDLLGMSYANIKYDPYGTMDLVRQNPWFMPGREEVFSFSKFNVGHKVVPDINEIFMVTFKE